MQAPGFFDRPPGLASFILLPFGLAYGAIAAWRMNRAGVRAGVPVICIGNPTLGGAGKTPTAIAIARMLATMGEQPVFVSRGYGGNDRGPVLVDPERHAAEAVGDEPLLLSKEFPTVVARDRVAAARLATQRGASVLVLDDGFQNPTLAKDLSLLVIDGANGIGNGEVFPAGPLRAPIDAQLDRAQGIIRVGHGSAADAVVTRQAARKIPVLAARLMPDASVAAALAGTKVLAFAGIGRPEKFFAMLASIGAIVTEARAFADHHPYSRADAVALLAAARARGLVLVTTEKDHARLQGNAARAEFAAAARTLPVRMQFEKEGELRTLLEQALHNART